MAREIDIGIQFPVHFQKKKKKKKKKKKTERE